ncbi:MAG: FliM/FliN family flagellar motor C-terminal domain-containing protein [Terracidiphilus sp.]|nr:FliM/FliN family flagellar motor C-terminal domain-containing protein [Terracidiphilus sp.]
MATSHPLPATATGQLRETTKPEAVTSAEAAGEQALVPLSVPQEESEILALNPSVARLPVELDVTIPVREFRVRSLLALEPGQLIESQWGNGDDVPLASGDVQLAWCEFEVVDTQLAIRLTRLV